MIFEPLLLKLKNSKRKHSVGTVLNWPVETWDDERMDGVGRGRHRRKDSMPRAYLPLPCTPLHDAEPIGDPGSCGCRPSESAPILRAIPNIA